MRYNYRLERRSGPKDAARESGDTAVIVQREGKPPEHAESSILLPLISGEDFVINRVINHRILIRILAPPRQNQNKRNPLLSQGASLVRHQGLEPGTP